MRRFIIIITIFLSLMAFGFSKTKGFITNESSRDYLDYCTQYQGTMANDNVIIEVGIFVFSLIFINQIIFIKKNIFLVEILLNLIICIFQSLLIYDARLDGCSIWKTIVYTKNVFLVFYLVLLFLLFVYNFNLLILRIINKKRRN